MYALQRVEPIAHLSERTIRAHVDTMQEIAFKCGNRRGKGVAQISSDRAVIGSVQKGRQLAGAYTFTGKLWVDGGQSAHEVQDTLIHELAHAFSSPSEGHGDAFRRLCALGFFVLMDNPERMTLSLRNLVRCHVQPKWGEVVGPDGFTDRQRNEHDRLKGHCERWAA